ncbi:MAG TPA: hypothetical protein VHZ95_16540, partial [Polyangiales bacterium]|nr:hypothetical protein [Polyangiales bacterium]
MTASLATKPTLLESFSAWLVYDETLVVEVEGAYTTFLQRAKFGWWLAGSIVAAMAVAIFVASLRRGEPKAQLALEILP